MAYKLTWKPPALPRQKEAVHSNTAEYAAIVHNGATLRNGGDYPASPWMLTAYFGSPAGFDPVSNFVDRFNSRESISDAFHDTANKANSEMKRLLRGKFWDWPRTTKRRNGTEVSSPRDKVDTRNLLNSQEDVRFR